MLLAEIQQCRLYCHHCYRQNKCGGRRIHVDNKSSLTRDTHLICIIIVIRHPVLLRPLCHRAESSYTRTHPSIHLATGVLISDNSRGILHPQRVAQQVASPVNERYVVGSREINRAWEFENWPVTTDHIHWNWGPRFCILSSLN